MGQPWTHHPNWDDQINDNFARGEIEGGAWLRDLEVGKQLSVVTTNRVLVIEHRPDGLYISGDPQTCPQPVPVVIAGSTWGGSMLKMKFIGIGMFMEYRPETSDRVLLSTLILDVKEENGELYS